MPRSDTDTTDDEGGRHTLARKRRALTQTKQRVRSQSVPSSLLMDEYIYIKSESKSIAAGKRRREIERQTDTDSSIFEHEDFDFLQDFAVFRHKETDIVIWVTPIHCKPKPSSAPATTTQYFIFPATTMLKDTNLVQYVAKWADAGDPEAEIAPGMPIATSVREYWSLPHAARGRPRKSPASARPVGGDDDEAAPTLTIVKSATTRVPFRGDTSIAPGPSRPLLSQTQPPTPTVIVRPVPTTSTPSPARSAPKLKPAASPVTKNRPSPLPAVPSLPKASNTPSIFDNLPTFTEVAATMPGMPLPILHPPHRAAFTKHMLDALVKNRGDTRTPVQMAAAYALGEIASSKSTHDQLVSVCRDATIVDSTFFNSQFENPTQCTNGIIMHTSSQKATDLLLPWPLMFAVRASEYSMRVAGRASEEACEALTKKNADLQAQLDATKQQFDLLKKQAEEERAAAALKQDEVDALFKDLMGLRERALVCMQPSRKRPHENEAN